MSSTGNCLVFHGNQVEEKKPILSVESFRLPSTINEIQDGEILVKILVATVCGSDLHTITAKRSEPTPSVLGHEGCGEVILSRRSDISIGQIVTFAICHFCQDCINCKENSLEQKCKKLFKYGHSLFAGPSDVPSGCYSTHILLKSGTAVVTIPPEVPLDLAATANCALATVANVVDLAETFKGAYGRLKKHRSILILGGGLLCLFGIAMLRELGYYDIDCAEMDLKRGETISIFGANFIQDFCNQCILVQLKVSRCNTLNLSTSHMKLYCEIALQAIVICMGFLALIRLNIQEYHRAMETKIKMKRMMKMRIQKRRQGRRI